MQKRKNNPRQPENPTARHEREEVQPKFTRWTANELQTLREQWKQKTPRQIGEIIGRTRKAVLNKAVRLKLGPGSITRTHPKLWTPEEEDELQRLLAAGQYTMMDIAEMLGRTETAVEARAYILGIYERPAAELGRRFKWRKDGERVVKAIRAGYDLHETSAMMGLTERQVRGYLLRILGTCSLEKIKTALEARVSV